MSVLAVTSSHVTRHEAVTVTVTVNLLSSLYLFRCVARCGAAWRGVAWRGRLLPTNETVTAGDSVSGWRGRACGEYPRKAWGGWLWFDVAAAMRRCTVRDALCKLGATVEGYLSEGGTVKCQSIRYGVGFAWLESKFRREFFGKNTCVALFKRDIHHASVHGRVHPRGCYQTY